MVRPDIHGSHDASNLIVPSMAHSPGLHSPHPPQWLPQPPNIAHAHCCSTRTSKRYLTNAIRLLPMVSCSADTYQQYHQKIRLRSYTSGTQQTGNCSLIYIRNMLPRCSICRFTSESLRDLRASFARKYLLQESITACLMPCRQAEL